MREELFFLKAAKCEFKKQWVKYLGLILDKDSIKLDPVKVNGLKTWLRTLKTVSEVCSTLRLLNYHYTFVPSFSHIVKLLTQLLKKNTKFLWMEKCMKALNKTINILTMAPVLTHPDPEKPFELEVDALDYATSTILFQRDE
jgi:hypothetical protein